jgi:ABC-type proline/glycine betaine transport system substrate-binding protein
MNHLLNLQIPEELYQPLMNVAVQMGQTPEEIALKWLSEVAQQVTDDPIEQFIGTIPSHLADWTT